MTSIKSTSNPRDSLRPPFGNRGSPNAPMVNASNVRKSITEHVRQRDLETVTPEEKQDKSNQQRLSLGTAVELINSWKKTTSTDDLPNVQKNNDQMKTHSKKKEKNSPKHLRT